VVLTTFADDSSILAALQGGARSYLTKDAGRAGIAQALRATATGLSVLDPAVHSAHTIKSHINRIFAKPGPPTAPPRFATPATTISLEQRPRARPSSN